MKTLTSVSAAHVSRVLRDADIEKSETGYGRVSSVTSEGFAVIKTEAGVIVRYVSSSIPMRSDKSVHDFEIRRLIALTDIYVALSDKGYKLSSIENGFTWVVGKAAL